MDVIALVGTLRFREHRSVPEIHQELLRRDIKIAERTVKNLIQRYEELVAVHVTDRERIQEILKAQGSAILAIDGLQPDAGHEVLWVIREVISHEILLARPLTASAKEDLVTLLSEVKELLPTEVSVKGIISDGQKAIGAAVNAVFPTTPHQLCQIHYLRDAAEKIVEADKHAKKELKAQIRGIRPIERVLEKGQNKASQAAYKYCLAIRSAIADDGHPPLDLGGIKLQKRLSQISDSLEDVTKKRGLDQYCRSSIQSLSMD